MVERGERRGTRARSRGGGDAHVCGLCAAPPNRVLTQSAGQGPGPAAAVPGTGNPKPLCLTPLELSVQGRVERRRAMEPAPPSSKPRRPLPRGQSTGRGDLSAQPPNGLQPPAPGGPTMRPSFGGSKQDDQEGTLMANTWVEKLPTKNDQTRWRARYRLASSERVPHYAGPFGTKTESQYAEGLGRP